MQRLPLFLLVVVALLITNTVAEEEWSWGSTGKKQASSSSGRTRTGRKQSSGRVVFEDEHGVDVKPRNPRLDLSLKVDHVSRKEKRI